MTLLISIIGCGPLTAPENGHVDANIRNAFPALGIYTCAPGLELVGSAVVQCQEDGSWNDSAPICRNLSIPVGKFMGISLVIVARKHN